LLNLAAHFADRRSSRPDAPPITALAPDEHGPLMRVNAGMWLSRTRGDRPCARIDTTTFDDGVRGQPHLMHADDRPGVLRARTAAPQGSARETALGRL
jgi:hypothetical protein